MNFNKFQRTIILLLLSLVVSHCNCNKDTTGGNPQKKRQKGSNPELTEEQKKQKQAEQERQRQEELAKTIKEEKVLENQLKNTLQQLKQKKGILGKSFAKATINNLDKFKKEPAKLEEEIKKLEELQDNFIELEPLLKRGQMPPLSPSQVQEFTEIFEENSSELKEAIYKARPINPDNLSSDFLLIYNYITNNYPTTKKDPMLFLNTLATEFTQIGLEASKTLLPLYKNIQRQNELRKGKK